MQGNVQSIDALRDLYAALLKLAESFSELSFEVRTEVARAVEWITQTAPQYWRYQLQVAERHLTEAQDNLASMQATYGGRDKPPATEARKRVITMRRRVALCQQRLREIRRINAEIERAANLMVATSSNLQQQAESELPKAAARLGDWIQSLDEYNGQVRFRIGPENDRE